MRRGLPLLFGLLALAGCGHPRTAPAGATVTVTESEYRITPSAIRAHTGSLTFVARNLGRLTHNFVVNRGANAVAGTSFIPPGRTATLLVDLPPGRYTVISNLFDDANAGMYGSLTIVP